MAPLVTAFALVLGLTGVVGLLGRRLGRGRPKAPHDRSSAWLGAAHTVSLTAGIAFPWLGLGRLPFGAAVAWAGVAVLIAGSTLQVLSMLALEGQYTLALQAGTVPSVVTRGPYRWVRHPGYLAQILTWLGFAVASRNACVLGVVVLADLLAYANRIRVEEHMLLSSWGEAYRAYAARTKRLVPGIW